ncbi:MAG: hypothetical protein J6O39_05990 [Treponema sp.]|nr:hypothetical protein [Treponema sp.]
MLKNKLFVSALAAVLVFGGMTACSNDDEDENKTSAAESVAASYTVDQTYTVYSSSDTEYTTSMGSASDTKNTIVIEAASDSTDKVNITLPGVEFTASMKIASFTIENVAVTTSDNDTYTFTLGEFTATAESSDGTEKAVTGISLTGSLVKSTGAISLKVIYKYGSMPMVGVNEFTTSDRFAYSDCYGTYWGTLTVSMVNQTFDMAITASKSALYVYASYSGMTFSYESVEWIENEDGTLTVTDKAGGTNATNATFTMADDGTVSAVLNILKMSTSSSTLTKGDDYNFEYATYKPADLVGYGYTAVQDSITYIFTFLTDSTVHQQAVMNGNSITDVYYTYVPEAAGTKIKYNLFQQTDATTLADTTGTAGASLSVTITNPVEKITIGENEATLVTQDISSIYGNDYSFQAGSTTHTLTINSDSTVSYSMGTYGTYSGTWTSTEVEDDTIANCTDFDFTFTEKDETALESNMVMSWRIRVVDDDHIQLINTTRGSTTLATKAATE